MRVIHSHVNTDGKSRYREMGDRVILALMTVFFCFCFFLFLDDFIFVW